MLLLFTVDSLAVEQQNEKSIGSALVALPYSLDKNQLADAYSFAGLASYLNSVRDVSILEDGNVVEASNKQATWVGTVGRYHAALYQASSLTLNDAIFDSATATNAIELRGEKSRLATHKGIQQLSYSHLWSPLAMLCRALEFALNTVSNLLGNSGIAIIAIAILIKILLLPITIAGGKAQKINDKIAAKLNPELASIKKKYDGETAHIKIMEAHKKLDVSPFYTLKPLLFTLLQLPFLIAMFNVLGESYVLVDSPFLWAESLAYPDAVLDFNSSTPLLGSSLNLFPIAMLAISLLALIGSENKLKMFAIAVALFILFYPFPAAMVLYWTVANALQMLQQRTSN